MAVVTVAQFKQIKPQFDAVGDDIVQLYIDMAGLSSDASWGEAEQTMAIIAMTCHLMTLDGLGSDKVSRSFAKGLGDMQTIKSADLTLVRFQREAGQTAYQSWLQSTPCGQQYYFRLKMSRGGPRVAMAASGAAVSGYAKDAPINAYGWPGVFCA